MGCAVNPVALVAFDPAHGVVLAASYEERLVHSEPTQDRLRPDAAFDATVQRVEHSPDGCLTVVSD